jgi:hypothetical protein
MDEGTLVLQENFIPSSSPILLNQKQTYCPASYISHNHATIGGRSIGKCVVRFQAGLVFLERYLNMKSSSSVSILKWQILSYTRLRMHNGQYRFTMHGSWHGKGGACMQDDWTSTAAAPALPWKGEHTSTTPHHLHLHGCMIHRATVHFSGQVPSSFSPVVWPQQQKGPTITTFSSTLHLTALFRLFSEQVKLLLLTLTIVGVWLVQIMPSKSTNNCACIDMKW